MKNKPNTRYVIPSNIDLGMFILQDYTPIQVIDQTPQFCNIKVCEKSTSRILVAKVMKNINLLQRQYKIYRILQSQYIPKVYKFGSQQNFHYILIQYFGYSLETLKKRIPKFSKGTINRIVINILKTLKFIHSKGIIHRDIKPDNIVVGANQDKHSLYLINYGVSEQYQQNDSYCGFFGTQKYASIRAHKKMNQRPCDDLESLGYIIIQLLIGYLPWNQQKQQDIKKRKIQQDWRQLCKQEEVIKQYFCLIKNNKQINYDKIMQLFQNEYNQEDCLQWCEQHCVCRRNIYQIRQSVLDENKYIDTLIFPKIRTIKP